MPILHGKVSHSATEQGVDSLSRLTVSINDEAFDAGILTQPSAIKARGLVTRIVVMDLSINSTCIALVLGVVCRCSNAR